MKAKLIKELLSDYLQGTNLDEINKIINLEKSWKTIVGNTISRNTKIISQKNGILIIKASNPIWRNELSLQKQELIEKIKEIDPKHKVTEIIFK